MSSKVTIDRSTLEYLLEVAGQSTYEHPAKSGRRRRAMQDGFAAIGLPVAIERGEWRGR